MIHNKGTKHKVWIEKKCQNNFRLYGEEWEAFVKDSSYTNVAALHFIQEEADTYYVTAYGEDGSECGGYNRTEIGARQMRCLATIQNDLGISPVSAKLNEMLIYELCKLYKYVIL